MILIIFINLCGILLKSYGLERHIILLGFRFHISLLVPCVMLFRKNAFEKVKSSLSSFKAGKAWGVFFIAILPALLLTGGLFLINGAELTDPDYFYELGLSSIFDYPVYLIWNLPQILIAGLFLNLLTYGKSYRFPLIMLILVSLFAFELMPEGKEGFNVSLLLDFAASAVLFSVFFSRVNNVYYLAVYAFTVLWSHVLLFGSKTEALVNMLLAKNYNTWEGFFLVSIKSLSKYTFLLHAGISLILLLFMIVPTSEKDNFQAAETNKMGIPEK